MFREYNVVFEKNFKVFFNNAEFPLTDYVRDAMLEIKPDNVPSVIVYPDGKELNTMMIPYLSIYSRYKNFFGDLNDLTEDLKVNEFIYYDNRLGKFKGKKLYKEWGDFTKYFSEDLRNSKAIKIEFAHGAIDYITENDFFKITRYKGDATRLNNIGNAKSNKIVNELIEMFELSKKSVSTLINSSILYVKNKCDSDAIINNTSTQYGKIKFEKLSKVVPLAYWNNSDKAINYSGNKHGLRSVVDITCSLENAIDLLYDKDGIQLVVLDLADFRGVDYNLIDQIIELCEDIEIVFLLPFEKYNSFTSYFSNTNLKQIVIDKSKASKYLCNGINQNIQINQRKIFDNFVGREVDFSIIDENREVNFMKIYGKLKSLTSGGSADERVTDIVNKGFNILSTLKTYIAFDTPVSFENTAYIKNQMKEAETDILKLLDDDGLYSVDLLNSTLLLLKELVKRVISVNELSNFVKDTIKYGSGQRILFIVQNNRIKSIIDSYLKNRFKYQIIHCKTISKMQDEVFYDAVYVLGVIPNENYRSKLFSLVVSKKIYFVYYKSYENYIKRLYNNNVIHFLEDENDTTDNNEDLANCDDENDDYNLIQELTSLVSEYNYKDAFRVYFGNTDDRGNVKCDYLINFNEYIGVFKKDYKVYRLNLHEENLDYVKISSLSIGDEILILNEQFKSGAFIDEIITALLLDEKFYKKNFELIESSKIWKVILIDYLKENDIKISDLYKILVHRGLAKTYPTFRNWILNDYIVGPDNASDYELIFSLVNDHSVKWQTVYEACNRVRSLHIKLRHDIGKMIVESYFNGIDISDNLRYLDIDFMDKVSICEVAKIDKGDFSVANYMVNAVKRREA